MMKKSFSYIKYRTKQTNEYDEQMTRAFILSTFILSNVIALIAISGRPSGATFIHLSLDFVFVFLLNALLFSMALVIIGILLSICRIPIPRLLIATQLYIGTGHGLLLYFVDTGTIFAIIIAILTIIFTTLISLIFHVITTYGLWRKLILFSFIGTSILTLAFLMGKIEQSPEDLRGPHHVQFFTYGTGEDPYRVGFGEEVTETTETVDASDFITNWSDKRRRFWKFGPENFPINGRVFMPDGDGPYPVILTVHGNHTMENFSTDGYDYLGESLASHGFIFISVDEDFINYSNITGQPNDNYMLRTWILLKHLVQLQEMNEDPNSLFYQKVNLQEIALSGHSRGGQAAAMGADYERFIEDPELLSALKDMDIKAVAAISPTDKAIEHTKAKLEDVSYFVLHGAQDADVYNFRGEHQYNRTTITEAEQIKATLYIEHANHVQFNTDWGRHDLSMPKGLFLNQLDLLSEKEQQQIALTYLTAFYKEVFQGEDTLKSLIENETLRNDMLPETRMIHQYQSGNYTPLIEYNEHAELLGTFTGFDTYKVIRPKNRSNGTHPKQALHLQWQDTATYQLPLNYFEMANQEDDLVITLANYAPEKDLSMTVTIETGDKEIVTETLDISPVIVINQTPFGLLDTYFRDGKYTQSWEPMFETFQLPIDNLYQSSLEDAKITIEFNGKDGEVLLQEIGID